MVPPWLSILLLTPYHITEIPRSWNPSVMRSLSFLPPTHQSQWVSLIRPGRNKIQRKPQVFADSALQPPRYSAQAHGNWIPGHSEMAKEPELLENKIQAFQCVLGAKNVCASLGFIAGKTAYSTKDKCPHLLDCSEPSHFHTTNSGCCQSCEDRLCQHRASYEDECVYGGVV